MKGYLISSDQRKTFGDKRTNRMDRLHWLDRVGRLRLVWRGPKTWMALLLLEVDGLDFELKNNMAARSPKFWNKRKWRKRSTLFFSSSPRPSPLFLPGLPSFLAGGPGPTNKSLPTKSINTTSQWRQFEANNSYWWVMMMMILDEWVRWVSEWVFTTMTMMVIQSYLCSSYLHDRTDGGREK